MSVANQVTEFVYRIMRGIPWGRFDLAALIMDADRIQQEFIRFLENGGWVIVQQRAFPLWRTVVLGRHKTPEAYLASLEGRGRVPNKWARDIAAKVVCAQQETELPLVDVLDTDLGFTGIYTTQEFYSRAATFGIYPCPAEAGLALPDQFDDQPKGDYRCIAMEAIADSGGYLDVFYVYHDADGLRLLTDRGHPEDQWYPGYRWVLTTRKP